MLHQLCRKYCRPQAGQKFKVGSEEYQMAGKLGDGAIGLVRKAIRLSDNAPRAVKFLAPDPKYIEIAAFDDVSSRFAREGERGSKLNHPFLTKVFGYCANEGGSAFGSGSPTNPFLLMELLGSKTLDSYIKHLDKEFDEHKAFLPDEEKLDLALQIVEGLEHLHRKKMVHRDIKPANIFVFNTPATNRLLVKIGDFGIVKWGDFHASLSTGVLTATNQKGLGTLKYMAPEQALDAKKVCVKSDIYSLGITLFELFVGRILASPHHVFEIHSARMSQGTTVSRFYSMGYRISGADSERE